MEINLENWFKPNIEKKDLKELSKKGALIANNSGQHDYLHLKLENETDAQWQSRIKQDILSSQKRIKEEIGHNYKYLAYPYGEFNNELQALVTELGFVGIGQHSGAVNKDSNSLWGESVAVDEYLSSKPERIVIDSIPFFQKGNNIPKIKNKQPKDKFSNYYKP